MRSGWVGRGAVGRRIGPPRPVLRWLPQRWIGARLRPQHPADPGRGGHRRGRGRGRREWFVRAAGIAVPVATLAAFGYTHSGHTLLGFSGSGLDPSPQAAVALIAAISAIVLLAATLIPAAAARDESSGSARSPVPAPPPRSRGRLRAVLVRPLRHDRDRGHGDVGGDRGLRVLTADSHRRDGGDGDVDQ